MSRTKTITVRIRPEVIAIERTKRGINTSKELAEFLGVNRWTCSQIENGGSVSATVINNVAQKLGLEINQLVKLIPKEEVGK